MTNIDTYLCVSHVTINEITKVLDDRRRSLLGKPKQQAKGTR